MSGSLRITVLCPHFAPDTAPTGTVMTRIVEELGQRGHQLDVVTALPWYRDHSIESGWEGKFRRREQTDWGSIRRLHPFPSDKSNLWGRAGGFAGFSTVAAADAAVGGTKPDVVFAMSPPLTLALSGWVAARRWGVPLVFNVQDVFPDVAIAVGALKGERVIRAAEALERFCYERSAAVTVLSDDLADGVRRKIASAAVKPIVEVIPNFADVRSIRPGPSRNEYRERHGLGDQCVVMYAGNIGHSQSFDLLLGMAKRFGERSDVVGERSDVVFVVNGEGVARSELERQAAGLSNVRFVDFQEASFLSETLSAADVHLVLLKAGLAHSSVPSKVYSIMAAGRPIVASIDRDSEIDRILTANDAGLVADPGDLDGLTAAVEHLVAHRLDRSAMGERARHFVESWPDVGQIAERYEELFHRVRASS